MQRILVLCASVGLVGAFRVNPRKGGVLDTSLAQHVEEKAPRAFCHLSGDPHILTFDTQMRGGPRWHPMHAPGHWWLVKTREEKVSVQATYGECGLKHGGGWMALRLNGVPRTCMTGIAVGGRFLSGSTGNKRDLVIQTPCDWDWENSKCRNTDTQPRITWDGKQVTSVNEDAVSVAVSGNHIKVGLPDGMEIHLSMGGRWNGVPYTYMDASIYMVQGSAGEQCGHCGNFNGDRNDDMRYEQTGLLKDPQDDLCDAAVHCNDRLIPGDAACKENGKGTTFTLEDCPADIRQKAEAACKAKFEEDIDAAVLAKLGGLDEEQLNDCVMDACLDDGFVDDDAADAKDEDDEELQLKR